jgi:hypothetical protein
MSQKRTNGPKDAAHQLDATLPFRSNVLATVPIVNVHTSTCYLSDDVAHDRRFA